VETHDAVEVSRAVDLGARLVGVNARNLSTFELDRELFGSLADRIPSGVIRIAESAVSEPADVARYRAAGADVVLVGEALVTGGDPVAMLESFLSASPFRPSGSQATQVSA
jgi:indole-3-glycerol phosphate synthase